MKPLTTLLDWIADRFPLNVKYNANCHSNHAHYEHPLDTPDEVETPSLFD